MDTASVPGQLAHAIPVPDPRSFGAGPALAGSIQIIDLESAVGA